MLRHSEGARSPLGEIPGTQRPEDSRFLNQLSLSQRRHPGRTLDSNAGDRVHSERAIPATERTVATATRPTLIERAPVSSQRFQLLTDEEIERLPDPEWLIDDVLPCGLSVVAGQPGIGKSFLALDWSLAIANGRPWLGHEVNAGHVIYVSAEGGSGIKNRIRAWKRHHEVERCPLFRGLLEPVNLPEPADVSSLLERIRVLDSPPELVVIDTMARCFGGGDENAPKDMNAFITGADRIRAATGATILVVHHMPKNAATLRGHSSLNGAADAVMFTARLEEGVLKLT